ncbi:hypothetical protein KLP40_14385 [Hymenobacter sp. NST-14]|uniref:hypothetical protein n=1 Tax=Hymenobacter piscis TaxID=2839984 RepID=UPI001C030135|nr:hypothetical protein [Hymenobacter piscis]MBT9394355.1 hypothetical protein [Hymenobacter piscis]
MNNRPDGCAVQAENRTRQTRALPNLLQDAGLSCWQTPKARRWSFAKTKARVRLDYDTRRGTRRPVSGPPQPQPQPQRAPVRTISVQLDLFSSIHQPLAQAA